MHTLSKKNYGFGVCTPESKKDTNSVSVMFFAAAAASIDCRSMGVNELSLIVIVSIVFVFLSFEVFVSLLYYE